MDHTITFESSKCTGGCVRSTFPKSSSPPKSPEIAGLQVSILYRLTSEYFNHDFN